MSSLKRSLKLYAHIKFTDENYLAEKLADEPILVI